MAGSCELDEVTGQGNPWYTRRVGSIVSGIFVVITIIVTCINVTRHTRNYRAPKEQRQIIPSFSYLSLIYVVYEVIALSAFLYLMIQYVANAAAGSIEEALSNKDKTRLPAPWCCFRFRPTKASFIHMVKWLVLQFVVFKPIIAIISIILYAVGLMCPSSTSATEPNLWLGIVEFLTMVTAVYGLLIFYRLTKQDISEHRPLLKFGIIKGVVFLTIFQELVFKILHTSGTIKPTESWTGLEVADGLNAFLLTIEMTIASIAMLSAFSASEYSDPERPRGTPVQAIIDSLNFGDFFSDMKHSLLFFLRGPHGVPHKGSDELLASSDYNELEASHNDASLIETNTRLSPKNETRIVAPV
ncbi:Transmembrane protein 184 homolog DDB_G0279555 [Dictyostelium discoideum] [Rhizoctonia solani]|uniref:Transmembrane protein 184 homolog DDB_G0279555 [Dictyostelium discoideum] n=1 Tax=Rhizoctonia solani TaxID=456999 RepID=A0A0K6FWB7_9AGAM|nr:Transmembrane protein 184 homolog DDB_G0279555 [Dictyostelium discoideum] [Rhizoctonia solani]